MSNKHGLAVVWLCQIALGCGSDAARQPALRAAADSGTGADALDLPVPGDGFQVATLGHEVPAGADQEWCEVVALPGAIGQTYYVGRTELAMTPFSHHLIVSVAPPGSHSLVDAQVGQITACLGSHIFGADLVDLAASAKPYSEQRLPDGVGLALTGGQRVVFDYHSLNTGDEPIHVQHRLNLHLVSDIQKIARTFGFYNEAIEIPAHTQRSFTEECRVKDDLLVWSLTRHTHRRGTDFRVWWVGGDQDGELLWTSNDWEQDILYNFDAPVVVRAGTGFRWECAFDNTTDQSLNFGALATDEMCILFGAFAAAGDNDSVGPQSCFILPR